MRYLVSEQSAAILRALGAPRGGVSFDGRRIDRTSPARPRPFACRIVPPASEGASAHLFCYIPPLCSECIRWKDAALAPTGSLGTVADPWVDLGAWSDTQRVWLAIAPPVDPPAGQTSGGYAGGWGIVLSATAPSTLSGHAAYAHLVAAMETATGGEARFVQYHLGSMLFSGEGDACQDEYSLDCQATTSGEGRVLQISLVKTPCEGEPETVDTCNVPLFSGRFVTDIISLAVSGSNLVITYSWSEFTDGVRTNDGTSTVSCPVTTCS